VSLEISGLVDGDWQYIDDKFISSNWETGETRLSLSIADPGDYRLRIDPPSMGHSGPLSTIVVYLRAISTEDGLELQRCTGSQSDPCAALDPLPSDDGVFDLGELRYEAAGFTGSVVDPDGNPVGFTSVSILRRVEDEFGGWWEHVAWTSTDAQGNFAVDVPLLGEGDFIVNARPPWGETRWSRGVLEFTISLDDQGEFVMMPEPVEVILSVPNVTGTVRAGTASVRYSSVSLEQERLSPDEDRYWEQLEWIETDNTGQFRLNASEGAYRLVAYPSWNTPSEYSEGMVTIVVNDAGEVTSIDGVDVESPESPTTVDVNLRSANIFVELSGAGRANAWVDFSPIDLNEPYNWLSGVGRPANSSGRVSAALDDGYELHGSPAIATRPDGTVVCAQAVVRARPDARTDA
jgi:hypothetical protein